MKDFSQFLTTQLVIRHMQTGDNRWKREFTRRLKLCGIGDEAVEKVWNYTRDIFRQEGSRGVEDSGYIRTWVFDLKEHAFPKYYPKSFTQMVEEDRLTFSEVVKAFDEAEWRYNNREGRKIPAHLWAEIVRATRYGTDLMNHFVIAEAYKLSALGMTVQQAQILMGKERAILFRERWGRTDVPDPYPYPAPAPMGGQDWTAALLGALLALVGACFLGTGAVLAATLLMEGMPGMGTRVTILGMLAIALVLGFFALRGGVRIVRKALENKRLPWSGRWGDDGSLK